MPNPKDFMTQNDHDVLITLVATVANNHNIVLDKINDVGKKVDDVKDGNAMQIANHELRIKELEKLRDELSPKEIAKQVETNSQWIRDFRTTWKVIVFGAATIGGIVGFILSVINQVTDLFK